MYIIIWFLDCFIIWDFHWPTQSLGNLYRAAASALNLEHGRLQKLEELCERNQIIRSSSKQVLLKTDIGHVCLKALNYFVDFVLHALSITNYLLILSVIFVIIFFNWVFISSFISETWHFCSTVLYHKKFACPSPHFEE